MRITKENIRLGTNIEDAIYALAQTTAKMAAAPVGALTDNSGGAAANTVLTAILTADTAPVVGANVPTKAAAETALGQVRDGLTEIGAQIIAITLKLPVFVAVNSIGGAAADGTIPAVTVAPAADNIGPRVSRAGFNTLVTTYRQAARELSAEVNALAVICGVAKLTGSVGGTATPDTFDHVYAALATDTGTAATDSSLSTVAAESTASLTGLRDAIAEMSATLNAITSDAVPATSVFVS